MTWTTRSEGAAHELAPRLGPSSDAVGCDGQCASCDGASPGSEVPAPDAPDLAGWRLAATSFAVFCVPIALAIIGAALWGGGATGQLAGGICGLVLGAVLMRSITRRTAFEERENR